MKKMLSKNLEKNEELYSTQYGRVNIYKLVENTGKIVENTLNTLNKEEVTISISLPKGLGYVWEDFDMFGHSLEHKSKLQTLFKTKEDALIYLIKTSEI